MYLTLILPFFSLSLHFRVFDCAAVFHTEQCEGKKVRLFHLFFTDRIHNFIDAFYDLNDFKRNL